MRGSRRRGPSGSSSGTVSFDPAELSKPSAGKPEPKGRQRSAEVRKRSATSALAAGPSEFIRGLPFAG